MTNFVPLESLLTTSRAAKRVVSVRENKQLTWKNWLAKVAAWQTAFSSRDERVWALYHSDSQELSCILFALWSLNKIVCLPGSKQPALVEQLTLEVDAFVGEFDHTMTIQPSGQPGSLIKNTLNLDAPLLQVHTSGSTGKPEVVPKTLRQLSREILHLHELWGQTLNQALVLSTVSHQHIYGLLFRVLWPLAEGWCFNASICEYLEEITQHNTNNLPILLVSSPTHLGRIPQYVNHYSIPHIQNIFSSGAPLSKKDSLLAQQFFNVKVKEVYGSTETGGIVWREQVDDIDASWQPMPNVEIKIGDNGCLAVRSEHLPNSEQWFQTADRVRMSNHSSFTLLGRADRIVKVEGKRVSLNEIENWLLQLQEIETVRLVVLERQRIEIGAVVVLSASARTTLNKLGKRAFNQQLNTHLIQRFERPLLPRRWRYQQQLPTNSQGKVQQQKLLDLFMVPSSTRPQHTQQTISKRPRLPTELTCKKKRGDDWQLTLYVQEDLLFFDGHFDKTPILPGVVQIHWAEHFARRLFTVKGQFIRLEAIKFQQVIPAGHQVILNISYHSEKQKINFSYHSDSGQHSSGRIVFGGSY
ncbi:hypothetical protein AB835_07920 [Candidatus Endobugula sertula]|uniref:Uncharacterized protein n=1 Tax=Candidatus Endobugula sertula TaxID=62101 RepID=A0A1D2QPY5_9GAMM|nr:hypothetical protein AB835_07920 [Candidatus Endobugula sertula]